MPPSVLIANQMFSFSVCFVSHGIASTGGSGACVLRREELHVSDLGDGHPVAVAPAVTMQTTERPSGCHVLSWGFQGNCSYHCFA